MTETPAAAQNTPETAPQARNAYLPVLPDGWRYAVMLKGPGGELIQVEHEVVSVDDGHGANKRFDAPSLKDGVKAAVNAARALVTIAEGEARIAAARRKLLDTIGPDAADEPKPGRPGKPGQAADSVA